ncbi:hypothetical protein AKJ56_00790 [candidate division MSBL1 archaeon SCGC-AAA382N08]|uniref:Uncharacterized protein n=1 Tax=candidate division MSBL1 archaeon SCGC-AAA382N08 TaxID=1698285 RepID=A0A133VQD7_9EURY|nr:hypothetical protein AKJ56_00790 [candidate division MSBL1 archaeon SCGC-AAA382N08]
MFFVMRRKCSGSRPLFILRSASFIWVRIRITKRARTETAEIRGRMGELIKRVSIEERIPKREAIRIEKEYLELQNDLKPIFTLLNIN